jgi:hypothetical protein
MPLVYAGVDEHGVIWIIDRKDEKTFVMLACSRGAPFSSGVAPDGEDADSVYPLFDEVPSAIVDVTALPPGYQRFDSQEFVPRAAQAARQHEPVTLDEYTAEDWGLQRPDAATQVETDA